MAPARLLPAASAPVGLRLLLGAALLATVSTPALADVPIATVAGSDVSTEGLLQYDFNAFDDDVADLDGDPFDDDSREVAVRRAEVVLKGAGPGRFAWAVGYDFAAEKFLDAYGSWKFEQGTTLVVGQSKVPLGLEELSSSRTGEFIAKASATGTFAIGRRLGLKVQHVSGPWTFAGAVFGRELTRNMAHGGGFAGRVAWAPVLADGRLLHLGAAIVDADTDADQLRLRARPQADLAVVRLVDAGTFRDADRLRTLGLEGAWVHGPVKLQGEWMHGAVDRYASASDFDADASYVSALWNVTGETWTYKAGVIGTPAPAAPSRGLWQLGLRHDRIDLDDGAVDGGAMSAWTVGVNWYWGRHTRLSLNHVQVSSERRGVDDDPSILEARVQLHW